MSMTTSHSPHNDAAPPDAGLSPGLFETVVVRMLAEHPDDERGRMLRSPGLRTAGRFYAFATSTHLVVKLPADRVAALVRDGAGSPCDPRGGHPLREWVRLTPEDAATAIADVRDARAFVAASAAEATPDP